MPAGTRETAESRRKADPMKRIKKEIAVGIEYHIGRQEAAAGYLQGGVPEPSHLDEVWLDVADDTSYDEAQEREVPNGRLQLNLRGSARAYRELARYLLAICEYGLSPDV